MISPWIKEQRALITYSPRVIRRICPIFPKSIPLPPDTLLTRPLKISVVAFPRIFGPAILNIVPQTAKSATKIMCTLNALIYLTSFFSVPLKSFALSPGMPPRAPCPPILGMAHSLLSLSFGISFRIFLVLCTFLTVRAFPGFSSFSGLPDIQF